MTLMTEAAEAYLAHARIYYKDSREYLNLRKALERVADLSSIDDPRQLDPKTIKALREDLIDLGLSRGYINQTVSKLGRIWKWFESEGYVERGTYEHLKTVEPLKENRTRAKECEPREPVSRRVLERTIEVLPAPYNAIVALLDASGARVGEIVVMRTVDIDQGEDDIRGVRGSDPIWWYRPHKHKTSHHKQTRLIPLDSVAQSILVDYLLPFRRDDFIFPASGGLRPIAPNDVYGAIKRACKKHNIPHWSPHQTRHKVATEADRAGADLTSIQELLGHRHQATTERYIQKRNKRAREALDARRERNHNERRNEGRPEGCEQGREEDGPRRGRGRD